MKLSFKRISLTIFLLFLALAAYWLLRYYVWQPLNFDDYVDRLYWERLPEDPEGYTTLLPAIPLDPLLLPLTADSKAFHHFLNKARSPGQMARQAQALLQALATYRPDALSPAQQLIYEQLQAHFRTEVEAAAYPYLHFPLNAVDGQPWPGIRVLIASHPVSDTEEADAYLSRLRKLPDVVRQALAVSAEYEQQQLRAPQALQERSIRQLQAFISLPPAQNPLYTLLARRLGASSPTAIHEGTRVEYLIRAESTLEERVYPALQQLIGDLESQLASAPEAPGIWQYPGGDSAYAFVLRKYTGEALAPDTAFQWGARAVAAAQKQLEGREPILQAPAQEFALAGDSLRAYRDDFFARGNGLFDDLPEARVGILPADQTMFFQETAYAGGSRDGSREAALFLAAGSSLQSTAYRHLLPGRHLLRSLMLADSGIPHLMLSLPQPAFEEGWAAYADALAMEYGFFLESGRPEAYHQAALLDGARLVLRQSNTCARSLPICQRKPGR